MRKRVFHAAIAALIMGLAGTARAVPLYFDFTGTILGVSGAVEGAQAGQAVSAGFNLETDRLQLAETPSDPNISSFVDYQPASLTEPLAFLRFGDREVNFPVHSALNMNIIMFTEACSALPCAGGDSFTLQAMSSELPPVIDPGFTGTYWMSSLFFIPIGMPAADVFDPATLDPTALVDFPLTADLLLASYSENSFACVAGVCSNDVSRSFSISVDSVTRGLGPRAAVPEPVTLSLLGAGLLGIALLRRRRLA